AALGASRRISATWWKSESALTMVLSPFRNMVPPMLVSEKICMGGFDLFFGFLPVDLGQVKTEDGLDQGFPVRRRIQIGFPHRTANQLRHRGLPSPRQRPQLLEFFRIHQKLSAPGCRHACLLFAHAYEHEYIRTRWV